VLVVLKRKCPAKFAKLIDDQGRNQDFAKGGGRLLMTYFRQRNLMTSPKWRHNWCSWSFITS